MVHFTFAGEGRQFNSLDGLFQTRKKRKIKSVESNLKKGASVHRTLHKDITSKAWQIAIKGRSDTNQRQIKYKLKVCLIEIKGDKIAIKWLSNVLEEMAGQIKIKFRGNTNQRNMGNKQAGTCV